MCIPPAQYGSVVVEAGNFALGGEAVRWTAGIGIRCIQSLLESQGVTLTGWRLYAVYGVYADGTTIIGEQA